MATGSTNKEVLSKKIDRLMKQMKADTSKKNTLFLYQEDVMGIDRPSKMQLFQMFICFGSTDGNYSPKQVRKFGLPQLPQNSTKENIEAVVKEGKGRELVSMMEKALNDDLICEKSALIFALALCSRSTDIETKKSAYKLCPVVCTTSQDLFNYNRLALLTNFHMKVAPSSLQSVASSESAMNHAYTTNALANMTLVDGEKRCGQSGQASSARHKSGPRKVKATCWGRAHRAAITNWYKCRDPKQLAFEVVRQRSGCGWSHHDLVKQCHIAIRPEETDCLGNAVVLRYIVKGINATRSEYGKHQLSSVKDILGFMERLHAMRHWSSESQVTQLILDHAMQRPLVPTQLLKSKQVWAALMHTMSTPDFLDNIISFASFGFLNADSDLYQTGLAKISGKDPRLGPYKLYSAWKKYQKGQKGDMVYTWVVDGEVLAKLNSAFQTSIKNLGQCDQKIVLAVHTVRDIDPAFITSNLTRSVIADVAALAKILSKSHDHCDVLAFMSDALEVRVKTSMKLADVCAGIAEKLAEMPQAKPLCSAPIQWALAARKDVDVFIIYTDSEEMGDLPLASLHMYRARVNNNAKLVYCNPKIAKMRCENLVRGVLHVCPFDANALRGIATYVKLPDV